MAAMVVTVVMDLRIIRRLASVLRQPGDFVVVGGGAGDTTGAVELLAGARLDSDLGRKPPVPLHHCVGVIADYFPTATPVYEISGSCCISLLPLPFQNLFSTQV